MSTSNWMPCAGCSCPNHHFPPPNTLSEDSSLMTMDLTRLMRSNDLPLPAEADAIRGMISQHEERVATIDLRISVLSAFYQDIVNLFLKVNEMITALRGERERDLVEIQTKKGLLSAVRRLPSEILFQIFRETIEFPIKVTQSNRAASWWDFTPVPCWLWTIGLVSRRWRTVTLTFPELWSYISIIITDDNFEDGNYGLIRRLGLQLARSQQSFLSLSIYDDEGNSIYEKLPSSLELLLLSVSNRLRELHLCMTAEMLSALPSLHLPLPSLEILSILCTNALEISKYSDLQLICNAPKLRGLTFIDVEDPAGAFAIPWAQITCCDISQAYRFDVLPGPDPSRFLNALRLMTNLTNCDLVCYASSSEFETERVACAKLQELSVTMASLYCDNASMTQLFNGLIFPSLSCLRAKCSPVDWEPSTFRSIWHAINVSQSPLTTLEFEHGLIAEEDLLSILRTTPTLEFLKLVDVGPSAITDQTLDELMVRPNEGFIMPRLSSLHLSAEVEFTSQKFVAMVESRQKGLLGVDRLKSVNICWVTDEDDLNENEASGVVILSALDTYRSEGLEFILTMQKKPAQDSEDETED